MIDRIKGVSGRTADIINPSFIQWGLYALAIVTVFLLIIELLCHGIVGTNPIQGSCRHFITLQFIDRATTFSFSLTAFLLVGVVVVSSFLVTEEQQLELGIDEFELQLGEGGGGDSDRGYVTITEFEDFESGDKRKSESGLTTWFSNSFTQKLSHNNYPKSYEILRLSEEKEGLGLGGKRYAVRDIETEEADPDLEEKYDYRIKGRGHFDRDYPGNRYYIDPEDERPRIHWLLREEEPELRVLERQLRRAVSYSISASVLGVLIQGYPWLAATAPDPWLLDLSFPETVVYIPASYLFTLIFLGMIGTSVGLLELMSELLKR